MIANASAAVLLDAWAEPTRRRLVERLVARPSSATELARDLPISRSAVSQHLQVLKGAGLVSDEAHGTRRIYRVDPEALAVIRAYFDAFWSRSLTSFGDTVRDTADDAPDDSPDDSPDDTVQEGPA